MYNPRQWQIENLKKSGVPADLFDDVIISDYEPYPGHLNKVNQPSHALSDVEELSTQEKSDSKSWQQRNNDDWA